MISAFRLVKKRRASTAFDGEGAATFGGRWNSQGVRLVYASGSRALAALETLVHIDRTIPFEWVVFQLDFPKAIMEVLPEPDPRQDWRAEPPTAVSQQLGDKWVSGGSSAVLRVPSALIPEEPNFLLNPAHPGFARITIHPPVPFVFDGRLANASGGSAATPYS